MNTSEREEDITKLLFKSKRMAINATYCSLTQDGQLIVFDYLHYLGDQLYWLVKTDMDDTRAYQKEVGFWHDAMTPERVMGMVMAAGFTTEELMEMISDSTRRGEIVVEAFDVILDAVKTGSSFAKSSSPRHPVQRWPVWQTLSPEATKAVLAMRPLF